MKDFLSPEAISRFMRDGRVFSAHVGAAATPVSFAKTAFDADQPQLVIDVPANTTIIPVSAELALQDSAGTDTVFSVLASTVNVAAGTSTAVTPVNHRFGHARTSLCSAYSLYTANGTDPATGTEQWLAHHVYAFADTTVGPIKEYDVDLTTKHVMIDGTGSLVVYISATTTAPAGYLKVSWIEVPTGDVS